MIAPASWRAVAVIALALIAGAGPVDGRSPSDVPPDVALSALPREAQATLKLIVHGGPFPYHRDGVVFGNREHRLPARARGYYHEYTVPTPGARDRGARRIICGGDVQSIDECYYSNDHYQTFRRIQP
jgi:ribonuclease T1